MTENGAYSLLDPCPCGCLNWSTLTEGGKTWMALYLDVLYGEGSDAAVEMAVQALVLPALRASASGDYLAKPGDGS